MFVVLNTASAIYFSVFYLCCFKSNPNTVLLSVRNVPSVTIEVASNLPTSAGLGSSAAYSTCLASSLLQHRRLTSVARQVDNTNTAKWSGKDVDLINQWAFVGEKIIHGNPSGIDNSVSTYGKFANILGIYFEKIFF